MNSVDLTRRALLWTAMLIVPAAMAKDPVDPINKDAGRLAVKGHDVVAYFTEGKPVKGSPEFSHEWNGAKWQFASKQNLDLFRANPGKYAPQYGGYCAWAVGHGYTADTDPEAWRIVDSKLYLNYNKSVQGKWQSDQRKWIESADRNWPGLHN